jgi:hypothetical protein
MYKISKTQARQRSPHKVQHDVTRTRQQATRTSKSSVQGKKINHTNNHHAQGSRTEMAAPAITAMNHNDQHMEVMACQ